MNINEHAIQRILDEKLIVIIRGVEIDVLIPLVQALYDGGIRLVEVTFDHKYPEINKNTIDAIKTINENFGDMILTGAGTVVTTDLIEKAYDAGAKYIVSPNTDPDVIRRTKELEMVSLPGAFTPSECIAAYNYGADFIKLFPAGEIGAQYLKALCAPLSHLRFIAVGGINETNISAFIKAGAVGAGVGGNLVNKHWIADGEFDKIRDAAKKYVEAVNS